MKLFFFRWVRKAKAYCHKKELLPVTNRDIRNTIDASLAILDHPGKWTQHRSAAYEHGATAHPWNPGAYAFCILGAIDRATGDDTVLYSRTLQEIGRYVGKLSIANWNDAPERTYEDVVDLLKTARDNL